MTDITSYYLQEQWGHEGDPGPDGPTGLTGDDNANAFMTECYHHYIDGIEKFLNNYETFPYYYLSYGIIAAISNFKPTLYNALQKLILRDRRSTIIILQNLTRILGYTNPQLYKDIFLLCLLNCTPEQINSAKLISTPGHIRKFNVEQLLMFGADINLPNVNGETVLMQACRYGTPEMVRTLLSTGAYLHTENNEGLSAFDYAKNNLRYADDIQTILSSTKDC